MEEENKTPPKSKKELLLERMSVKYPDKDFTDEEALYGQIGEDYDANENELTGLREREESLANMFASDPRSASFLNNWRDGADPIVELVRQFGTEIADAIDDPEKQEEIAKAHQDFLDRVAKDKQLKEEFDANIVQSLAELDKAQEEQGLTDEQMEQAMQALSTIVGEYVIGKITPDTIQLMLKAIHHDAHVAEAEHEAEVRGRNTKILEHMRKKEQGDGIPVMGGGGAIQHNTPRPKSIFELAEEAR